MKQSKSQQIKNKARRSLGMKMNQKYGNYVVDTSAIINQFLRKLIHKGLQGKIMIPNAVMQSWRILQIEEMRQASEAWMKFQTFIN